MIFFISINLINIVNLYNTVQVQRYIEENAALCQPDSVHICDGSEAENSALLAVLQHQGMVKPLPKYDNW